MGRTKRKRCRKKSRGFCVCDSSEQLVLLNSWLTTGGIRRNKKLGLAVFNDTGRGVLTKKKIRAGEELISLPLNFTINVITILMDKLFCCIFLENNKHCILEYKQTVTFQSLMAFYLTFLKVQHTNTKWHIYLENLPNDYTVPYFLPNDLKYYVDPEIVSVVEKQKLIIESSYEIFFEILKNNVSNDSIIEDFKKYYKLSVYEWAYFTVNTRCVYMDLSNIIDLKNVQGSILNLISDNTKIALCPYLDMINHNPNARNETKLLVRNMENLNINSLKESSLLDVSFSIYTKNNFDIYTQVFICYGDSHNLKLITEYGFFIPDNDLDCVTFTFEDIKSFLNSNITKLSQEQIDFILNHGLNKDLYIDNKGLSFNLYGVLMVVKYYYNKSMDVSKLIYSAAICSSDSSLDEILMPMVKNKLDSIRQTICKLEIIQSQCSILNNCVSLMHQYVCILEKFIKC